MELLAYQSKSTLGKNKITSGKKIMIAATAAKQR